MVGGTNREGSERTWRWGWGRIGTISLPGSKELCRNEDDRAVIFPRA